MPIRNTKTLAAYKAEYNALVQGMTAMAERAVQVRKNAAALAARGNRIASGPVFTSTTAIARSLKALPTFKGEGERNVRPASSTRR